MKYLPDTDTCTYIINERCRAGPKRESGPLGGQRSSEAASVGGSYKRPRNIRARFDKEVVGDIGISAITASELAYGVTKTGSARNRAALGRFMLPLEIAPYGPEAASVYG